MTSASVIFDVVGRDRASGTFDKVGNSADRSGGKMAKFGKVAKFAALGLAAGVGAAAVGLFKLAKGAAEDEAGQVRLARALKNSANATDADVASIEKWITKQGVAKGVADDQLRPAIGQLATATGDLGKAQELATLAMDISAGSGKSLESVTKSLAKAYSSGSVSALGKFGVATKDATGKARTLDNVQAELTRKFKGQASDAANTTAGKYARLKLILGETGETIGSKVLPIATKLATWFLNKGVPALTAFGDYLGQKLPPIFAKVKAVVSTVMNALHGDIAGNMNGIKGIFTDAVSIIRSLWNAFGGNIVQYLRAAMTNVRMILQGAFTVIRGIFKTVSALLKGDWRGVWEGIKTILRGAVQLLLGIVRQMFNAIRFAFLNAGVVIKAIFKGIWNGVKSLAVSGATNLVELIRGLPGRLMSLGGKFLSAGKTLIGKLWEGIKNAAGNSGGFVFDLISKLKAGMNDMLSLPVTFDMPKVLGGKHLTIIPAFARGGITPGGTALVGEEGPELVDLPAGSRVTPHRQSMARLGGGGDVYQITVNGFVGSEEQLVQKLEQMMIRVARNRGRGLAIPVAS